MSNTRKLIITGGDMYAPILGQEHRMLPAPDLLNPLDNDFLAQLVQDTGSDFPELLTKYSESVITIIKQDAWRVISARSLLHPKEPGEMKFTIKNELVYEGESEERDAIVSVFIADKIASTNGMVYAERLVKEYRNKVIFVDQNYKIIGFRFVRKPKHKTSAETIPAGSSLWDEF